MNDRIHIRIKDEEHSIYIQNELFKLGYKWFSDGVRHIDAKCIVITINKKSLLYSDGDYNFSDGSYKDAYNMDDVKRYLGMYIIPEDLFIM